MNVACSPSGTAPSEATETVTVPVSEIVVSAADESAVTSPAVVLAPVRVTASVSSASSTESARTETVIVPLAAPASSVSVPDGAV